jgi:hypothetical protein
MAYALPAEPGLLESSFGPHKIRDSTKLVSEPNCRAEEVFREYTATFLFYFTAGSLIEPLRSAKASIRRVAPVVTNRSATDYYKLPHLAKFRFAFNYSPQTVA